MNTLLPYYLFLVAGAVLLAVLRDSPLVSQKRDLHVVYLLTPPFVLILLELNLGALLTFLLTLLVLFGVDRLLKTGPQRYAPRTTFRLWLAVWLIEAAVPLSLHFALRSRPDLERVSLLVGGLILLAGTILTFLVFAPNARKSA